jgi:hypothetical protein
MTLEAKVELDEVQRVRIVVGEHEAHLASVGGEGHFVPVAGRRV